MDSIIQGKAWVGRDDIMVYEIVSMKRWNMDKVDPVELGNWAMEGVDPAFATAPGGFKAGGYSIVVAGVNFGGGGKSIEHPIFALKGAGVKAVLAESFSRFNFRNSVNNGLPVFVCPGILALAQTGDTLEVNTVEGKVTNPRTGAFLAIPPLPSFTLELINAGGLIPYTKTKLRERARSQRTDTN
jgi:3-isopropylmalate/(R)-2-methylmalate dehydratase small subunit